MTPAACSGQRATVYAICGIAFSGKSTLARLLADRLDMALIGLAAPSHLAAFQYPAPDEPVIRIATQADVDMLIQA